MVFTIKTQHHAFQYILFGHPVSHSLSPIIHQNFASQFNLDISYITQDVLLNDFPSALKKFREQGGRGANITVPLKKLAYSLCQKTSKAADLAQAVNTIYWDDQNILCGDNTDGIGLVRDLKNEHHQAIQHKNILIVGAGGAAAGILPALLAENPENIYLSNRTVNRAIILAEQLNNPKVHTLSVEQLKQNSLKISFDIIINATSASLHNELLDLNLLIIKNKIVYDLVYNLKQPTVFVQWARENGAKIAFDGLGMLIEQAAQAFYIWHHQRPDTQSVRVLLKK